MSAGAMRSLGTGDGARAMWALARRELVRFVRQPSRVVASVGTPLLFWGLAGSGLSRSFAMPGAVEGSETSMGYGGFLLPGMIAMVVLFSSIFAAISLIQDRQGGFLQSVIVSPAPAWSIVGAKVLGGAMIAFAQAALLLAAAPIVGYQPGATGFVWAMVAVMLHAVGVIGLGLGAAWWINSSSGFHGVMNMVLMPMWLLSGALFPAAGAAPWLGAVMRANPMHWTHSAIAASLRGTPSEAGWMWAGSAGFALTMLVFAAIVMSRRSTAAGAGGAE